jgi:hypothetical protein
MSSELTVSPLRRDAAVRRERRRARSRFDWDGALIALLFVAQLLAVVLAALGVQRDDVSQPLVVAAHVHTTP